MTTTINTEVKRSGVIPDRGIWWLMWRRTETEIPSPVLLPGDERGPSFINEYDRAHLIDGKCVRVRNNYINFTMSAVLADHPFESASDDRVTKPKDISGPPSTA